MKTLVLLALILVFSFGQAQDTAVQKDRTRTDLYELKQPAIYQLKNQDFTFVPDVNSIRIKRVENEQEVDFGLLRRTTDDGLYIMTSGLNDEVSFGRFDSLGNFRTLRYDSVKDSVLEDLFVVKTSGTITDPKK